MSSLALRATNLLMAGCVEKYDVSACEAYIRGWVEPEVPLEESVQGIESWCAGPGRRGASPAGPFAA